MAAKKRTIAEVLESLCNVIGEVGSASLEREVVLIRLAKEGRMALRAASKANKARTAKAAASAGRPRKFSDEKRFEIASTKGTAEEVSKIHKCSPSIVQKFRTELGIDPNSADATERRRQIAMASGSRSEVMQQFGCSDAQITLCKKEFGVTRRWNKSKSKTQ